MSRTYEQIIANRPETTFAAENFDGKAKLFSILDAMSVAEYARLTDDDVKKWFARQKWWRSLPLEERRTVMNVEFKYD